MKKDKGNTDKLYSDSNFSEKFSLFISTVFFSGFLPVAPGTWASAFTLIFIYLFIPTGGLFLLILCFLLFVVGIVTTDILERYDGIRDNPKVVIDEALGSAIAIAFLPKTVIVFFLGFVLFRFFDILKPGPIRFLDKNMKGGLGVMVDDIVAGIFANILIRLGILLFF